MNKSRRILSGGWLDTALSIFTRGYYLLAGEINVTYEPATVHSPAAAGTVHRPQGTAVVGSPQATGSVRGQ